MPRGVKNIKNTVAETMEANPVADTVGQSQPTETELLRQQNEALAKQLEAMQKQIEAMQKNPGSTVVMAKPEETVELTYIAAVSPTNVLSLGTTAI